MYTVKSVVCDYGIFENDKLVLICDNRTNAFLIKDILEKDSKYGQGFIKNPMYTLEDFKKFMENIHNE